MIRLALSVAAAAFAAAATPPPQGATQITLSIPAFPNGAVVSNGIVWVESHREATLWRIDPATNAAKAVPLSSPQCGPPAYGAGRIWYSSCFGITGQALTYGFNPKTRRAVVFTKGGAPAYAGGSVWMIDPRKNILLRADPRTGVVLKRLRLGISPAPNGTWAGSQCGDSLWTTNGVDAVQRTTLATNKTHVIALPGGHDTNGTGYFGVSTVACAAGKVWIPNGAGLFELDPTTENALLLPIPIESFSQLGDVAIVADRDSVYLRTSDTQVVQIDANTGKVTAQFPAAGGGGGIAVAAGSLWVVNAEDGTVWREPLP
jgi:streptogramin lyase